MREIKFRVWDKEILVMINWDMLISTQLLEDAFTGVGAIAMQYTGLKDKNGVEIYEGDIVKVAGTDENNNLVYRICEVVFNKGSYVFKFQEGFYFYHDSIFEVIGNIYENPELLENKE